MLEAEQRTERRSAKRVYYLSIDSHRRLLFDALINLRMLESARAALEASASISIRLRKLEPDAALGNGGRGGWPRATWTAWPRWRLPAYGLRHPLRAWAFMQQIPDGWQHELPERWLAFGNPWEFERPEAEYSIPLRR